MPEREDSVGREAAAGALWRAEGEIDDCAASEKDFRETKIVVTVPAVVNNRAKLMSSYNFLGPDA